MNKYRVCDFLHIVVYWHWFYYVTHCGQ